MVPEIAGTEAVVAWFGRWPSFHDAEVLSLQLNRRGMSRLCIHAWNITDGTYEQDGQRYHASERHAIVTFEFAGITALELCDFSSQNVISRLGIATETGVQRLEMSPCCGLAGYIAATSIRVTVAEGKPSQE